MLPKNPWTCLAALVLSAAFLMAALLSTTAQARPVDGGRAADIRKELQDINETLDLISMFGLEDDNVVIAEMYLAPGESAPVPLGTSALQKYLRSHFLYDKPATASGEDWDNQLRTWLRALRRNSDAAKEAFRQKRLALLKRKDELEYELAHLGEPPRVEGGGGVIEAKLVKPPYDCKTRRDKTSYCKLTYALKNTSSEEFWWDSFRVFDGVTERNGSYRHRTWTPGYGIALPVQCEVLAGKKTSQWAAWGSGHFKDHAPGSITWRLEAECHAAK